MENKKNTNGMTELSENEVEKVAGGLTININTDEESIGKAVGYLEEAKEYAANKGLITIPNTTISYSQIKNLIGELINQINTDPKSCYAQILNLIKQVYNDKEIMNKLKEAAGCLVSVSA